MKKTALLFILFISFSVYSQENEVKQTIVNFFDAFHNRDAEKLKSFCHQEIKLQSIAEKSGVGKLTTDSVENFFKSIASIPADVKFQEKILDYKISIDGTMAHVWTPYEFYWKEKLSHKGVNQFVLFKSDGKWQILYIIDTRQR